MTHHPNQQETSHSYRGWPTIRSGSLIKHGPHCGSSRAPVFYTTQLPFVCANSLGAIRPDIVLHESSAWMTCHFINPTLPETWPLLSADDIVMLWRSSLLSTRLSVVIVIVAHFLMTVPSWSMAVGTGRHLLPVTKWPHTPEQVWNSEKGVWIYDTINISTAWCVFVIFIPTC